MVMGRAAVFVEPFHFEISELPVPPVEEGGILVKITASGICGSDLHMWRGEIKPVGAGEAGPIIIGHEMTGVVCALGKGVSTDSMGRFLREGDRVVYIYYHPCRRCYHCLRGEFNNCPDRFQYRAPVSEYPYCNGGFAEYYYLNPGRFVFKVPDELEDESVIAVNCAVSQVVYAFHRGGLSMGDSVVVQGAGGLGINATAVARDMGARLVIVIDGVSGRLDLARECGADYTVDIREYKTPESRVARVLELTEGRGADLVMEVVGYPQVVIEGLDMLRKGGTFLEIGNIWPNSNVTLDMSKIVFGSKQIVATAHYDPYILPVALDFLVRTRDRYPLTKIISHRFPLEQIGEAFKQAEWVGKSGETGVTRVVVNP